MRISTLRNDPGYLGDAGSYRVTFNGAVLAPGSYVTADEERGFIVAPVLNTPGRYATLEGDVTITAPGLDPEGNIVTVRNGKALYL